MFCITPKYPEKCNLKLIEVKYVFNVLISKQISEIFLTEPGYETSTNEPVNVNKPLEYFNKHEDNHLINSKGGCANIFPS